MATASLSTGPAGAAERWLEGFRSGWAAGAGAEAFISHFRPMLAEDVLLLGPQLPPLRGIEAFEERFVRPLFGLMPDLRADVGRAAIDAETIFAELTITGTLRGGRRVRLRACDRIELRDGLAVERETHFDPSPLLAALALSPRSWPLLLGVRLRPLAGLSPLMRRRRRR
jgi:hypothetical protein